VSSPFPFVTKESFCFDSKTHRQICHRNTSLKKIIIIVMRYGVRLVLQVHRKLVGIFAAVLRKERTPVAILRQPAEAAAQYLALSFCIYIQCLRTELKIAP
jgi:hypothetical protein